MRSTRAIVATVAAVGTIALAAGCSGSSGSSGSTAASSSSGGGSSANFATCISATACGGMDALVAEARKEGHLNVITLPADWANYGTIMKDFTAKYGIQITDANPDGTSQDELNAIAQTKGQSRAPDVVLVASRKS